MAKIRERVHRAEMLYGGAGEEGIALDVRASMRITRQHSNDWMSN